jgi:hypothetical protein
MWHEQFLLSTNLNGRMAGNDSRVDWGGKQQESETLMIFITSLGI